MVTNTTLRQVVGCLVLVCVGIFVAPYASAAESGGTPMQKWHARYALRKSRKFPLQKIKYLIADYEAKAYAHEMGNYVKECLERGEVLLMSKAQRKLLQAKYRWDLVPNAFATEIINFIKHRHLPDEVRKFTDDIYMELLKIAWALRKRMIVKDDYDNCVSNFPLVKDYIILILGNLDQCLSTIFVKTIAEESSIALANLKIMQRALKKITRHSYAKEELDLVFNRVISALERRLAPAQVKQDQNS